MSTIQAPDLRETPPRSGRETLRGFAWLPRLIDKARAERAGVAGEYVAYCPLSLGFLRAAHVSRQDAEQLIASGAGDDEIARWFDEHVEPPQKEAANRFVLDQMRDHLDQQDAEEGRA